MVALLSRQPRDRIPTGACLLEWSRVVHSSLRASWTGSQQAKRLELSLARPPPAFTSPWFSGSSLRAPCLGLACPRQRGVGGHHACRRPPATVAHCTFLHGSRVVQRDPVSSRTQTRTPRSQLGARAFALALRPPHGTESGSQLVRHATLVRLRDGHARTVRGYVT